MSQKESPVFATSYLPNVLYYSLMSDNYGGLIDQHENFVKQSYRSRCTIAGVNGPLDLIIPLEKHPNHVPIKDVKISYDENWRKLHWKSMESAYRSSPYFEFYEDTLYPLYHEKKIKFLIDYNELLINELTTILDLDLSIWRTESFEKEYSNRDDYRAVIHPKIDTSGQYVFPAYRQVFGDRILFIPNLSIIDLIFNEGPNSTAFLI